MRRRFSKKRRTAAAMVETALTLPLFFFLVVAGIDLGLCIHARNQTAWIAGQLAQVAARHGQESQSDQIPWGPETVDWNRSVQAQPGDSELAQNMFGTFEDMTDSLPSQDVSVRLEWLDETNHTGDRVRASVHCTHQPLLGWRMGGGKMKAFSTAVIQR
jgi:hypothetical protein